ncbi:MAG: glucose-1-phosphate cytidylyltransferase [Planctomycetes bacterium TMED75]|nr:glucose-1-phosphate cytidylyltransferase [Planctomycetaceae bacterium]OUU93316.1 MAG: glucose-1-phosphate cytidylyltransferase [Planctomycetes bacterium TMED75]
MQVVILCGGQGTRIREVSENLVPKPMIPIGDRPIIWHIMKSYAEQGHTDFVLCLGHLGWRIKEYFLNHQSMDTDVTVTLGHTPKIEYHGPYTEEGWTVTLAETGAETGTGGRVRRVAPYLTGDRFLLTYGDGVSDIDLKALEAFHKDHGKQLTISGVIPPGRFGELKLDDDQVLEMQEKPQFSDRYINGGFMMIDRSFIDDYLAHEPDETMLERTPFEAAAQSGQMMLHKHDGFWQCMDTARDWEHLNRLWKSGNAPWRTWA